MKVSIIPWIVRKLKLCFALVEDGDTASQNIAQGKFVIWKGVCCKAASAITVGETLSGTNLPAISSGALNDISDSIPAVVNNLTSDSTTSALSAAQGKALNSNIGTDVLALKTAPDIPRNSNFNSLVTVGNYRVRSYSDSTTMPNIPVQMAGTLYVKNSMLENGANYRQQIYVTHQNVIYLRYTTDNGSTWSNWDSLAQNSKITRKSKQISSISVSANDIVTGDADVSSDPGESLFVIGFDVSASTQVVPMQVYMSNKNTIHYRLKNVSNSAQTCTLYVYYC